VKSGPDVFADALVPAARAFGAGALICQFLLNRFSGRSALTSPTISIQCAQYRVPRSFWREPPAWRCSCDCGWRGVPAGTFARNGYRCAKRQGKPAFTIWQKGLCRGDFYNSFELCASRAFTPRSSRTLNCPSNLIGHDRLNKPANGVGEYRRF
jgi:hypothetical protein